MAIGLESDLIELVKAIPAFNEPILNAFDPPKSINDSEVLARIGYNRTLQSIQKPTTVSGFPLPYLTWKGPFNFDEGQTAIGASGTKKVQFWFVCYHQTATDAMNWVNDINAALLALSYPFDLGTFRLTASLFVNKLPVDSDQIQQTSKEYPMCAATIGYTFGFQFK